MAGPNVKAPELGEALFDWFVDIRASLACAVTPRYVLYKAGELSERLLNAMRVSGAYTARPQLSRSKVARSLAPGLWSLFAVAQQPSQGFAPGFGAALGDDVVQPNSRAAIGCSLVGARFGRFDLWH